MKTDEILLTFYLYSILECLANTQSTNIFNTYATKRVQKELQIKEEKWGEVAVEYATTTQHDCGVSMA